MVCAIFYVHHTIGACAGICMCDRMYQMEKTGGDERAKMVHNDKNFYMSCPISQEPHIVWLPFMVHICKIIIYTGVSYIC